MTTFKNMLSPHILRPVSVLLPRWISTANICTSYLIFFVVKYHIIAFIKILLWQSKDVLSPTSLLFVTVYLHQRKILLQLHLIQLELIISKQGICITSHKFFGLTVVIKNKVMLESEIRNSYNTSVTFLVCSDNLTFMW